MFKIKISETPSQFECPEGDTLLHACLRAGLGLPYECSFGSCGTCKIEVLEGEVDTLWHESLGLSERDKKRGRSLACQTRPKSDCVIRVLVGNDHRRLNQPHQFEATLVEWHDLTHDMREFCFHAETGAHFLPGQYALLTLPGVSHVNGERPYSMSNVANPEGEWQFQIKRTPNGGVTANMFDQSVIGYKVRFDGPYGLAYLRTNSPRDIVCIAGGVGLAPMLSIARGFSNDKNLSMRKLHFFYGGRAPQDMSGEHFLHALPGFGESIYYYSIVSMLDLTKEKKWPGKIGFVHELVAETLGLSLPQYEFYIAGPPAMVEAVQSMLIRNKVFFSQIHFDRFY